jgi:hypothetical protein
MLAVTPQCGGIPPKLHSKCSKGARGGGAGADARTNRQGKVGSEDSV